MYRRADGAFGAAAGGPDIDTMFFANILGVAALLLRRQLDAARLASWTQGVAGAADFLVKNGNLSWYTNGNICLGNALTMALAWRLTGDPKYQGYYQQAIDFVVAPPAPKWAGRGLIYTHRGSHTDGADSIGYFTEETSGLGNPGYDPEYTQVQADILAMLYLVTASPAVLAFLNTLTNQLEGRLDRNTWQLDTSGGTRKTTQGRRIPYDTGSLTVLANLGGRTDLQPLVQPQTDAFMRTYASGEGDRLRGAFGWAVATVIMAQPGNCRLR